MKVTIVNPPAPPTVKLGTLKQGDAFKFAAGAIAVVVNQENHKPPFGGSVRVFNFQEAVIRHHLPEADVIPLPNLELVIKP